MDDLKLQELTLDVNDNHTYQYAYSKQYDIGRQIVINITKDGEPFDISDTLAVIELKKEDKTIVINNVEIVDSNKVLVTLDEQMTACDGRNNFQIKFCKNGNVLTTITVILKVEKSVIQNGDIESSSESNLVTEMLIKIESVTQLMTATEEKTRTYMDNAKLSEVNSANSAILSESYAVGGTNTRNGEDTDNSKYYAETANEYASNANTSASNAATSATNAKASETNAKTSETNAKSSENIATTKATEASESATNASDSATTATTKATESSDSATLSKSYAIGDTNTRAGEDTDNAKYYKEQAELYYGKLTDIQVTGVKGNAETEYRKGEVNITASDIGFEIISDTEPENQEIGCYWLQEYE